MEGGDGDADAALLEALKVAQGDVKLGIISSLEARKTGAAAEELAETFLVISGDVLTDIDLSAIWATHVAKGALATIGLTPVDNPLEFGIVITKEDGSIERFLEKPSWGEVFSDTVNTGIYVIEPRVLARYAIGETFDFSKDLFPRLLADGGVALLHLGGGKEPGHQAGDGLDHGQHGDLSPVQDVVAQGHRPDLEALVRPVEHALVDHCHASDHSPVAAFRTHR